jgi:S1-C subfamily serine protease
MSRTLLAVVLAALVVAVAAAGLVVGRATDDDGQGATQETTARDETQADDGSPTAREDLVSTARAADGVVTVVSVVDEAGVQRGVGEGSGFVLDRQGRILTAEHVVEGAASIHVAFPDGTKTDARLVAADPLLDLAVIEVDVPSAALDPLPLGRAEALRVGQTVVAIGTPFGLAQSVSAGIVSGLERQITAPNGFTLGNAIQTDAPVNHGNSGGPLLDTEGRVVGVNVQIADSGVDANVGVGFAVAIDGGAREAIEELARGRTPAHAWLGVSIDEIDAILATSGEAPATAGALVTGIVAGGPAADAGLRGGTTVTRVDGVDYCLGGDVIVDVEGDPVTDVGDLQTALAGLDPGETVRLGLVRADGSRDTATVTLGTQPTTAPPPTTGCGS